LFVVGINTALRASDLVRIKTSQVKHLKGGIEEGEDIEIKEKKTKKNKRVTFSPACVRVILNLLDTPRFKDELDQPKYLFHSRTGRGAKPLTVQAVHQTVNKWCKKINLKGNYGSHTLRKTWGYHQRVTHRADIPTLMVCLNHSSQKQTLDYLCIQPEEVRNIYLNEI